MQAFLIPGTRQTGREERHAMADVGVLLSEGRLRELSLPLTHAWQSQAVTTF
ncbi:hypothetical protein [Thermanaeromonas toyohensis]|uniref:hypothetical protein n=1 Tax=Thermanaeromonas toyohensis TaxID=161154 RepID=UPI0012F51C3F|nr:hypothetical protein [Thermanaeromonas toyohensis]